MAVGYEGWVARQACRGMNPLVIITDGSCPLPKARNLHFFGDPSKALARAPKRHYTDLRKELVGRMGWHIGVFTHHCAAPEGAMKLTLNLTEPSYLGQVPDEERKFRGR